MKKIAVLLLAVLGTASLSAQILDSLCLGAQSVHYEVIAPSTYEDFSAAQYGKQLLFVSSRETSLFSKKYDLNSQKFFDLYLFDFKSKEVSRYGDQLASLEKSKFHLGPATLLPDSSGIILSRNYRVPNIEDEVNFYLVYENWTTNERYKMPYCTIANSFQHPFYDARTSRLYFSANLPDGPGGYDIYYSEFLMDGTWGDPVIVPGVNGARDDVFPTIANDGRLFFSRSASQMGLNILAFDLKTQITQSFQGPLTTSRDEFSLITLNKDSAIFSQSQQGQFNTDMVLAWIETDVMDSLEKNGEPVVVIQGQRTKKDTEKMLTAIASIDGPAELTKDPIRPIVKKEETFQVVFPINGGIVDCFEQLDAIKAQTGADSLWLGELNNVLVIVVAIKNSRDEAEAAKSWAVSQGMSSAFVTQQLPSASARPSYDLNYYSTIVGVFESPSGAKKQFEKIISWNKNAFVSLHNGKYYVVFADYEQSTEAIQSKNDAIKNGVSGAWLLPEKLYPLVLPDISGSADLIVYFRFDKHDVTEKYQTQIDEFIAQLPNDVNRVFMIGHTDSRGTDDYNNWLSTQRVNEVADYLRFKHKDFKALRELDAKGESQLINDCDDGVECDPYSHSLNRRVELWFY